MSTFRNIALYLTIFIQLASCNAEKPLKILKKSLKHVRSEESDSKKKISTEYKLRNLNIKPVSRTPGKFPPFVIMAHLWVPVHKGDIRTIREVIRTFGNPFGNPAAAALLTGMLSNQEPPKTMSPLLTNEQDRAMNMKLLSWAAVVGNTAWLRTVASSTSDLTAYVSAMFFAVLAGHTSIALRLMHMNAPIFQGNPAAYRALEALLSGRPPTDELKSLVSVRDSHQFSRTLLHWAATTGNTEWIRALIRSGADPNSTDSVNWTPLHIAAAFGRLKAVKVLLDNGAKTDIPSSTGGFTPLHLAAQNGHPNIVRILLDRGASYDRRNKDGMTPLGLAFRHCNAGVINELLKRDPEAVTGILTPIQITAHFSQLACSRALLETGMSPDFTNSYHTYPLYFASEIGDMETAKLLVSHGAMSDSRNTVSIKTRNILVHDRQPIHAAAVSGSLKLVKLLAKHGAGIDASDSIGVTPLHLAAESNAPDIVKFLLSRGANPNSVARLPLAAVDFWVKGRTPLHAACESGSLESVKALLEHGAMLDPTDSLGVTPLYIAVEYAHPDIVSLLISKGARKDIRTATVTEEGTHMLKGRTLMHGAVRSGSLEMIQLLLRHGIPADLPDDNGITPLVTALVQAVTSNNDKYPYERIVSLLLKHGARADGSVTLYDSLGIIRFRGRTPLHLVATIGDVGIARMLLQHGARPDAPDDLGISPLYLACESGHLDMVRLLVSKGADIHRKANIYMNNSRTLFRGRTMLHAAALNDNANLMRYLLSLGLPPDEKDSYGITPLFIASEQGHINTMRVLLDTGASPHVRCSIPSSGSLHVIKQRTPLHAAIFSNSVKAIDLLVNHGADIDAADSNGITPLHMAAMLGYSSIIKRLLSRGARPDVKDLRGLTPLDYARIRRFSQAEHILREAMKRK